MVLVRGQPGGKLTEEFVYAVTAEGKSVPSVDTIMLPSVIE
jgi:hypothetical protein